ncbi:FAD-binding domain-containing protein [Pedobacter sp. GSP4]|uniref:FAD-binding domain-containing protein n=1 Tax=Pedobacter sp. GSP4 TaxID=3453716 RepID=UPI003EEB2610
MTGTAFTTDYLKILEQVAALDPVRYAQTRNFTNGAVSMLSPYISRGVISLKEILKEIIAKGFDLRTAEKFLQELAWREYYQRIWQERKDLIWEDIGSGQPDAKEYDMITSIQQARTGITTVDQGIVKLYQTGYMHNHLRMYIASIICNIGRTRWQIPSRWLYYHLLDGDIASNSASWQWVSGAFSSKKYYCNQENINKYTLSAQRGTFLDRSYDELPSIPIPDILKNRSTIKLEAVLPETEIPAIDISKPTIIYNSYNLDPLWRKDEQANRVLLLEPSHFLKYPVGKKVIDFIIGLSENISGIKIFTGELTELADLHSSSELPANEIFISKQHPAFSYYTGKKDSYDWMFPEISGEYSSFFKYWKLCRPYLEQLFHQA